MFSEEAVPELRSERQAHDCSNSRKQEAARTQSRVLELLEKLDCAMTVHRMGGKMRREHHHPPPPRTGFSRKLNWRWRTQDLNQLLLYGMRTAQAVF